MMGQEMIGMKQMLLRLIVLAMFILQDLVMVQKRRMTMRR